MRSQGSFIFNAFCSNTFLNSVQHDPCSACTTFLVFGCSTTPLPCLHEPGCQRHCLSLEDSSSVFPELDGVSSPILGWERISSAEWMERGQQQRAAYKSAIMSLCHPSTSCRVLRSELRFNRGVSRETRVS